MSVVLAVLGIASFVMLSVFYGVSHDVDYHYNKNHYKKYTRFGKIFIFSVGSIGIICSKIVYFFENINTNKLENILKKKEYRK